ncbi:hypothetical protein [Allocoleopsis franciscana]|uniref:Uncharacterized protein n=1 Tax=Allocoleopsis franciscana PCC 7113 TaxID=1173027 RepID=K9WPD3_9CYAN|nr:hypothetical protein [Allocoleopsis franciscana]AFZ22043.1 hypothetical protein Mic7113_6463 [Allocoleopsis franciscana PCC 7113]
MPQTIEFTVATFPSVILREDLTETWNDIGINLLPPGEAEPLLMFLDQLGATSKPDFNPNRILLVKAANGVSQTVYGPAIFQDGENIILKVGDNILPMQQKGALFTIGKLKGKVSVTEEKDKDGKPYPKATCSLVSPERNVFKVGVQLATKELGLTTADVEAVLINEEPIRPLLSYPPTVALKMQELGVGEYQVAGISESEGDYGISYKLHLSDGRAVWGRGNVNILLESGWRPNWEKPLTLIVSRIEKLGEDKFSVDCALRERLPLLPPGANGHTNSKAASPNTVEVEAQVVTETEESEEEALENLHY